MSATRYQTSCLAVRNRAAAKRTRKCTRASTGGVMTAPDGCVGGEQLSECHIPNDVITFTDPRLFVDRYNVSRGS